MNDVHTHEGYAPHDHDGAFPGHTHDDATTTAAPAAAPAAAPVATTPAAVEVGPSGGGVAGRMILTLLGAAGMILAAFLPWFSFGAGEAPPGIGMAGIEVSNSAFYSTDNPFGASFIESAGLIAIVLGLLALLGQVFRTGWLTILAGVLGIIGFILVVITLYRVEGQDFGLGNVGLGLWILLVGGILSVIAGFFGARTRTVTTAY
jgi:hypothetical protein